MQLGLEQLLVGQLRFVLRYQRGGQAATKRVFDDFVILAGAEQNADGWLLVWLANIPIQRLQVKVQFAEKLRLELADLQFNGNQAIYPPMEEEQVECEIPIAHL